MRGGQEHRLSTWRANGRYCRSSALAGKGSRAGAFLQEHENRFLKPSNLTPNLFYVKGTECCVLYLELTVNCILFLFIFPLSEKIKITPKSQAPGIVKHVINLIVSRLNYAQCPSHYLFLLLVLIMLAFFFFFLPFNLN